MYEAFQCGEPYFKHTRLLFRLRCMVCCGKGKKKGTFRPSDCPPPLPTRLAFASTQNEPICSVFLSRTCTTRVKGNSHKQTEFTLLLLCCSFIFTRLERLRWPLVRSNYWRNKSSNLKSRVYWSLAPTFPAEDLKTDNLQTVFSCCAGLRIKKSMCAAKSAVFLKCYMHGVLTSLLCHFGRQ